MPKNAGIRLSVITRFGNELLIFVFEHEGEIVRALHQRWELLRVLLVALLCGDVALQYPRDCSFSFSL